MQENKLKQSSKIFIFRFVLEKGLKVINKQIAIVKCWQHLMCIIIIKATRRIFDALSVFNLISSHLALLMSLDAIRECILKAYYHFASDIWSVLHQNCHSLQCHKHLII